MTTAKIRVLTPAELSQLIGWAKAEGWNPGLDDAAAFHAADPSGFFGCFVDGQMVAGISAVAYGETFGFIGLYISHPDHRGKGYGLKAWDQAMTYLSGRSIGLDGVPAQQANYARMGFVPTYGTLRWSGRYPALPPLHSPVVSVAPEHFDAIEAFDSLAFPAPRAAFLQQWLKPPRIARAIFRGQELAGYGVARRCHEGVKIGPLFASTDQDAETLFSALATAAGPETLSIDVPESQTAFSTHLAGLGFAKGFETKRMVHGAPLICEERLVFGVTTLELG
ncbi:GNAT superfamily N-acetyltransferase [Neorhizobium galegae]|uniref:GNAT family N-acetyltransferase n=1 Tax=Neorhizobium galegae TaxID=399 RepID=UPI001AE2AD21|nr:GNAT family N-acetyltransferase [Neorhizobium galegae]MBP2548623.1 GNAT superfamily N-acetyltransferase [Neorhizobium galegae]